MLVDRLPKPRHGAAARLLAAAGAGLGIAGLSYAGYAAHTWYTYGRDDRDGRGSDPVLDRLLPAYDIAERHETTVAAPAGPTWDAARAMDINRSPLVRAIFAVRTLPARILGRAPRQEPRSLVDETTAIGWRPLGEIPGRLLVMGAVTQPWAAAPVFRGMPAEEFTAFDEPGYVKIVWTLEVEPLGSGRSRFRTQTRAASTDAASRARFRKYWAMVSPGVRVIRQQSLGLVKSDAERRYRAGGGAVDPLPVARRRN